MNQARSEKKFLDSFKIVFPNGFVEAPNENAAYAKISERLDLRPEAIRTLIIGPLRQNFVTTQIYYPTQPQNTVTFILAYRYMKNKEHIRNMVSIKENNQKPTNEIQATENILPEGYVFSESHYGRCCNSIPMKYPMGSMREGGGVASVLCICPIHGKAWREG